VKVDIEDAPMILGSGYPAPFDARCSQRRRWRLGDAAGLTQFGVNLLRLLPQQWSSQKHWHQAEDEFVYILEGAVTLVTDAGETPMNAGDCAAFRAGLANGHHLQNRSDIEAVILEMGSRRPEEDSVVYPGIDLALPVRDDGYVHIDGSPYGRADK
jgi:uncharacterized cupin superfamily protein